MPETRTTRAVGTRLGMGRSAHGSADPRLWRLRQSRSDRRDAARESHEEPRAHVEEASFASWDSR